VKAILGSALAFVIALASGADAAVISIEVGGLSLAPDGAGQIDVRVTGSGESVNLAGYEFRITPVVGVSSQLRFVEEDEAFLNAGDYLFAGLSAAASDGLPSSIGVVSTTTLPGDTFVGGDGAQDFSDVIVSSNLLVRLQVQHDSGPADPATTLGHAFTVALVPTTGDSVDFSNGASNTGLVNSAFGTVAFNSLSGTVSVVVPEPGCLGLVALTCTSLFSPRRRTSFGVKWQ
jgi:hypothetical protein